MTDARSSLDWTAIERIARDLPGKTNLVVLKSDLPGAPPHAPSRLGRKYGALRQYRCRSRRANLHVKEYADRWVIHVDLWNPHRHPLRHLFVDHGYKAFVELAQWLSRSPPPEPAPAREPA